MQTLIYSLEDDTNIGYIIQKTLESAQYEVHTFRDATSFYAAFSKRKPDLVLLDLMLPDSDGQAVLKQIKEMVDIPVIILSAKNHEIDKVIGLDGGADDYITKPFGALELLARIKVALRKQTLPFEDSLTVGPIKILLKQRQCFISEQPLILTAKELELLYLLMQRKGEVVERDTIFKQVWGYDFIGESRTLDMHINSLRKKILTVDDSLSSLIVTIRGVGYMLSSYD